MKILMISNKIMTYPLLYRNIIETVEQLGHSIVWAADFSRFAADKNDIPCQTEQISINTNPLNKGNRTAYRQLLDIVDKYTIEAVMCSTPIGGMLARLVAKKKKICPVIYEAHGFLFFKGAPLINRTLYRWEELILAHYTDALITITSEDYYAAQKFKLRSGKNPYYVHGAGVNTGVTVDVSRFEKRRELGISEDAFIIVSAGELNKNKNTEVILKAISEMKNENIHYLACGVGNEYTRLERLADKLKINPQVHFLGYRTDIAEIMACSDAFVISSFREGIPRSLLEAMDLGLPCVGSKTRGIIDLIDENEGGYLCNPSKSNEFAIAFENLQRDKMLRDNMGAYNREKVKGYSTEIVRKELYNIYKEVLC